MYGEIGIVRILCSHCKQFASTARQKLIVVLPNSVA